MNAPRGGDEPWTGRWGLCRLFYLAVVCNHACGYHFKPFLVAHADTSQSHSTISIPSFVAHSSHNVSPLSRQMKAKARPMQFSLPLHPPSSGACWPSAGLMPQSHLQHPSQLGPPSMVPRVSEMVYSTPWQSQPIRPPQPQYNQPSACR